MPKSWAQPYRTGIMIRDFILQKGEAYPRQIFSHLQQAISEMGYHPPSYESVRRFTYVLEELRLIEFVREEPAPTRPSSKVLPRRYYRIRQDTVNDKTWQSPYASLYLGIVDKRR